MMKQDIIPQFTKYYARLKSLKLRKCKNVFFSRHIIDYFRIFIRTTKAKTDITVSKKFNSL